MQNMEFDHTLKEGNVITDSLANQGVYQIEKHKGRSLLPNIPLLYRFFSHFLVLSSFLLINCLCFLYFFKEERKKKCCRLSIN